MNLNSYKSHLKHYTLHSGDVTTSILSFKIRHFLRMVNSTEPQEEESSKHNSVC